MGLPRAWITLGSDVRSTGSLVLDGTVDLNDITFVRIVDILGSGDFRDSEGNPILDNWPTTGSGGFDLRAVGAFHAGIVVIPEPPRTVEKRRALTRMVGGPPSSVAAVATTTVTASHDAVEVASVARIFSRAAGWMRSR